MIRSMTGFASIEREFDFGRLAWELRSVNHRYLEIGFRLPEEFRVLEPDIRRLLGKHLGRGKVDATLRYTPAAEQAGARLELNEPLAAGLLALHDRLCESAGREQSPDLMAIMRWPGVVEEQMPDPQPLHDAALELLPDAIAGLREARQREGAQMEKALRERLRAIGALVGEFREWLPGIREGLRQKLLDRVADLEQPLDPGRLEQEVAFLVQKIDVDEELDRLEAHVREAHVALEMDEPVGRRLDFLMQEFNREANTLGSKSVDERTTQAAVELKVFVEQMREQVQNIE